MMTTESQNKFWKEKEQAAEVVYVRQKEQEQLAALREKMLQESNDAAARTKKTFEGGFGGQEDLEDRYATTSGEH